MPTIDIRHDTPRRRYELHADGVQAGFAEYELEDDTVRFTHTVVRPEYEGKGLGSRLAAFALDDVQRQGKKIVPECSFIRAYVARHPEYQPLVRF